MGCPRKEGPEVGAREQGSTVLLSDAGGYGALAGRLSGSGHAVVWYSSLEELLREHPLSTIAVLVVHGKAAPKGVLLATLGRMNLEYPRMQKVAVMEGPLPLPIAEYLTACGVELVWSESREEALTRLTTVLERVHERAGWLA